MSNTKSGIGRTANLISIILNPLWVGLIFFIWFIFNVSNEKSGLVFTSGILSTVVVPLLIVILMVKFGIAENIDLPDRKKRQIPFLLLGLEYAVFVGLNAWLKLPKEFQVIMWIVLANTLIYGIITLFWKVSIHAAGISGYITSIAWFANPAGWMLLPVL
ncbi:MAG: hypothetical protein KAI81_08355, partial [Candidatus Marinimicrobia bacterium]|nr:hypothetical protein [Candidatus Neomarinimicrobiota bacterium]